MKHFKLILIISLLFSEKLLSETLIYQDIKKHYLAETAFFLDSTSAFIKCIEKATQQDMIDICIEENINRKTKIRNLLHSDTSLKIKEWEKEHLTTENDKARKEWEKCYSKFVKNDINTTIATVVCRKKEPQKD